MSAPQGRGRGVRRNFDTASKEQRVGRGREGEEAVRLGGGGIVDSPIPEGFSVTDLLDMVDRLEVGSTVTPVIEARLYQLQGHSYTSYRGTVIRVTETQLHPLQRHSYTSYRDTVTPATEAQLYQLQRHSYTSYRGTVILVTETQLHQLQRHSYRSSVTVAQLQRNSYIRVSKTHGHMNACQL